jgi:hypothetical protein
MKTKSVTARVAALLFILAFSAARPGGLAGAQTETPSIKFDRGVVDEIFADGDQNKATARFPITLTGAQAEAVKLRIVDVVLGKRRESRLVGAFMPRIEAAAENHSQALIIEIDLAKITEQGVYSLGVEATGLPKPQLLELQIIVPAARLRPPGTLVVQEVSYLLWSNLLQSPLELQEVSGRSRLSDVRFSHLPASAGNPVIDGRLEFTSPNSPVAARGMAEVTYNLAGHFPLGATKGAVELAAPQLAEALTINYEVRKRLTKGIIFIVILLGLMIGFLLRTELKHRIELNQARLKAFDLRERIEKEKQRHPDEDFHAGLKESLARLTDAADGQEAGAITTAINEASAALTEALNQLKQRRAGAETKLNELGQLSATATRLPPTVREPIELIAAALEEARLEFRRDNIKAALEKMEIIRARLAGELQQPATAWRANLEGCLDELSKAGALLPATILPKLSGAVDALKPSLNQVTGVNPNATAEQISQALAAVQTAQMNAQALMIRLGIWLQAAATSVISVLEQAQIPDRVAIEHLSDTIAGFNEKAALRVDQPEKALKELSNDLVGLHEAWSDALLKQIPDAAEKDKEAVRELIKNRNYEDAAHKVVQIIKEKEINEGKLLGDLPAVAANITSMTPGLVPLFAGDVPAAAPAVVTRIERVEETGEPLEALRARTRRELFQDTLWQTVLVGALIALAGYFLFEGKFVGTVQDLAGIFFWAFGLDITVDALLQVAKGIKTS